MNHLITIILLLITQTVLCQNITTQTISWPISRIIDVNTGELTTPEDRIVSHGTTKIEWIDKKGILKKTFTITEVNGTWPNIQKTGTITYEVDYQGNRGTVTFQKTTTETEIRILVVPEEDMPEMYEMRVGG